MTTTPPTCKRTGSGNGLIDGLFWVAVIGFVYVMFHCLGNTVENVHSRSVFVWMVARWGDHVSLGPDYSFAWLVPIISVAAIWKRRKELKQAPRGVAWGGLVLVVMALALHFVGARIQQPRLSLIGLVFLAFGMPCFLFGWQVARQLVFPCGYLIFCIPFNFLDVLTFPLRMLSTHMSAGLLNGLGIPVERIGTAIYFQGTHTFGLEVADPCSGLRSLTAMMALAAGYGFFTQKTLGRKIALFVLSIPIAVLANGLRITTIAVVARWLGEETALRIYHDYSGYIIFGTAVVLMMSVGSVLERWSDRMADAWQQGRKSP